MESGQRRLRRHCLNGVERLYPYINVVEETPSLPWQRATLAEPSTPLRRWRELVSCVQNIARRLEKKCPAVRNIFLLLDLPQEGLSLGDFFKNEGWEKGALSFRFCYSGFRSFNCWGSEGRQKRHAIEEHSVEQLEPLSGSSCWQAGTSDGREKRVRGAKADHCWPLYWRTPASRVALPTPRETS